MEKISALIDKLQELKNKGATLSDLAYYTQLLYAELMCAKGNPEKEKPAARKKVAVIMPGYQSRETTDELSAPARETRDYDEIKKETPVRQPLFEQPAAPVYHAPRQAAPPLTAQGKELNEVIADHKPSLNDRLKTESVELAMKINGTTQIKDLSKAIDINEKFLFINELFRGDRNMYDRSIKTINECSDLESAEYWIERELKIKLGWQERDNTVQQFYQLVKKRFLAA